MTGLTFESAFSQAMRRALNSTFMTECFFVYMLPQFNTLKKAERTNLLFPENKIKLAPINERTQIN